MFADLLDEVSSLSDQDIAKEDFEEHFSLGTAYREMDLIEESIREFQSALKTLDLRKDAKKVVQCCGMLSTCFLKKGMPRSAVRWCQTGLSVADISSHEAMALRYDMGVAHSMAGSSEQALECFDRIFGMDPSYRDVAQRIDELRACP
jgi:tetratricopeptide (TPR) repeat protein